ncbi:MAG: glycosyltransferase [Nitrospirae bacterium]|nr:glycosyltransferase [Nitrospirota bacterium]
MLKQSMQKHDIIFIANEPWENSVWRRRHHIAWNLAKKNRVLFIEPPYSVMSPISDYVSWKQLLNLGRLKYQGRFLYSYSPFRLIPRNIRLVRRLNYEKINKRIVFNDIKEKVKTLKFNDCILWVNYSDIQYDYYHLFKYKLVVTDWYDHFIAPLSKDAGDWATSETYLNSIRERCDRILNNADIVFAVSKELYSELSKIKKHTYFIPHGVDYGLYENEKMLPSNLKSFLENLMHPVIGFVGTIQAKIDFDLLLYLKRKHPEWVMLLVGREHINNEIDRNKFNELKSLKNVYHIKHVNRVLIPAILRYVDVCVIPFKKNEFNFYSAPLKLWEYLSAGKPIVAVDQGNTLECSEFVKSVLDKDDFEDAIIKAIAERLDTKKMIERKSVARENSWDRRVNKMLELIEKELNDCLRL